MSGQWRVWIARRGEGLGWFRLLGVGLAWKDHRSHRALFSERYSGQHGVPKRHYLHLGSWCIHLTTWRHP